MVTCESEEQAYSISWACATPVNVFAYSTTLGTLTTLPIFIPQWHTNTPMRAWERVFSHQGISVLL